MQLSTNPFERGYSRFTITRTLLIDQRNSDILYRRQVHPVQAYLPDADMIGKFCKCDDEFALLPECGDYPQEFLRGRPYPGWVGSVVYSISAADGKCAIPLADAHALASAEALVSQLKFQTGHYNRCWEINSEHIPYWARTWMKNYIRETIQPPEVFFQAFEISNPRKPYALGFRLLNTPWTNDHLSNLNLDSQSLQNQQQSYEIPMPILDILHMAAMADIRVLIFDPLAPTLAGLPLAE